jgi:hypothetical protein
LCYNQQSAPLADEDDEDHGGLVKKIMESKKEYEQPRETKIVSALYELYIVVFN